MSDVRGTIADAVRNAPYEIDGKFGPITPGETADQILAALDAAGYAIVRKDDLKWVMNVVETTEDPDHPADGPRMAKWYEAVGRIYDSLALTTQRDQAEGGGNG